MQAVSALSDCLSVSRAAFFVIQEHRSMTAMFAIWFLCSKSVNKTIATETSFHEKSPDTPNIPNRMKYTLCAIYYVHQKGLTPERPHPSLERDHHRTTRILIHPYQYHTISVNAVLRIIHLLHGFVS